MAQVQDEIQKLMRKDMDRKDFIKHVGVGFVAITGISTLLKTLTSLNGGDRNAQAGYGSGAYGGSSKHKA